MLRVGLRPQHPPDAGITLLEALIVIGILLSGISLATHSLNWLRVLIQPPNPAGASAAIQLVKDISSGTAVVSDQACGLVIDNRIRYSVSSDHVLTRQQNGDSRHYPGIACVGYNQAILRIFGDRYPGSCPVTPAQAQAIASATLHRRCEYEEQAVISHRWN